MPFGIARARLDAITDRHAAVLTAVEEAIGFALIADDDIAPDELTAVTKWISAVRFAVMIQAEGREPHDTDFVAFTDAVCEAVVPRCSFCAALATEMVSDGDGGMDACSSCCEAWDRDPGFHGTPRA